MVGRQIPGRDIIERMKRLVQTYKLLIFLDKDIEHGESLQPKQKSGEPWKLITPEWSDFIERYAKHTGYSRKKVLAIIKFGVRRGYIEVLTNENNSQSLNVGFDKGDELLTDRIGWFPYGLLIKIIQQNAVLIYVIALAVAIWH